MLINITFFFFFFFYKSKNVLILLPYIASLYSLVWPGSGWNQQSKATKKTGDDQWSGPETNHNIRCLHCCFLAMLAAWLQMFFFFFFIISAYNKIKQWEKIFKKTKTKDAQVGWKHPQGLVKRTHLTLTLKTAAHYSLQRIIRNKDKKELKKI